MRQNAKHLLVGLMLALAYRLVVHRLLGHRPRSGAERTAPAPETFQRSPQQPPPGGAEYWTEERMRQARPMPMPNA
jgi:hypothetical protein